MGKEIDLLNKHPDRKGQIELSFESVKAEGAELKRKMAALIRVKALSKR